MTAQRPVEWRGDGVRVELAVGREQLGSGPVLFAGDRSIGAAVEQVADLSFEERTLLLDDDDLVEPLSELEDRLVIERVWHPHAEET